MRKSKMIIFQKQDWPELRALQIMSVWVLITKSLDLDLIL